MSEHVRIIFLGGISEIGKNMMLFETPNDIIAVDMGLGFPSEDQLGVDLLLPDIEYLKERKDKLRGIFITHGHEDHIGGLPWLWDQVPAPIYATKLTAGLIKEKLKEKRLADKVEISIVDADGREKYEVGDFTVEPFRVTHSIPDCVGYGVTTPQGLVVVTGDFKLDPTPADGNPTDIALLEDFRERGVQVLISDTTNAEREGSTKSESVVAETLKEIFAQAPGRIILATFASSIARIQQVIDEAAETGRRVAPMGRSLENNVRVAMELGYLTDDDNVLVAGKNADGVPADQLVYVVTGSQGEPMAVLSRIAYGEHNRITVGEGDTVVISASPIPGNETAVYRVIDLLFEAGAEVIYPGLGEVHVSGHARRDELREMIRLTKPAHVVPTHGEPRMLHLYADLAVEEGIPRDNVHIVGLGDVLTLDSGALRVTEQLDVKSLLVEGMTIGRGNEVVLRDRQSMAEDGLVTVGAGIDWNQRRIAAGPKVTTRGFNVIDVDTAIEQGLVDAVRSALDLALERGDDQKIVQAIRDAAQKYVYGKTKRRPVVEPIILDM